MKNKHLHPAVIITWISLGVLIGLASSVIVWKIFLDISWLIVAFSLIFICFTNKTRKIIILALFAGIFLGLYRGANENYSNKYIDSYIGQNVTIKGVVSEDTSLSKDGQQRIILKDIVINNHSYPGNIWVSTSSLQEIKRSQILELEGLVAKGFGSFTGTIYRAQILRITEIEHSDPAREIRDWFADGIRNVIPEPQSSLGIGFLTGQHNNLPEDLNNNLRLLGLTHIIVASGYNLTILVRFSRRAFARVSKYLATLVSGLLISGFVLITGFSPSMTRASIITGLSLAAWYYGRKIHPVTLLLFVAAITAFVQPAYIWGDLGWYLSFSAFAGVIILSPLLINYFFGDKKNINPFLQIFSETLSAQILTAPIIAFAFGLVSPLSLVANLLILSLIPLAMIFTFVAGIAGVISKDLTILAAPSTAILTYMTTITDKLAALPFSILEIQLSVQQLVSIYLAIIVLVIYMRRRTNYDFMKTNIIE